MPIPAAITDLSTTPGANSPSGGESVTTTDDYLRTGFAFDRQLYDRMTDGTQALSVGSVTVAPGTTSLQTTAAGDLTINATNAAGRVVVRTANTDRVIVDAVGNVGFGVVPNAWGSSVRAFDLGANLGFVSSSAAGNTSEIHNNSYFNGSAALYKNTAFASKYTQFLGAHVWYVAQSGTAGTAITFTEAARIHASGGVSIGNTTDPGATNLSVTGNVTAANIQTMASGTYTPTITVGTAGPCNYIRVGSTAFITGTVVGTVTANTVYVADISIPIARGTAFSVFSQGTGVLNAGYGSPQISSGTVAALTGGQLLRLQFISNLAGSVTLYFSCSYTLA